MRIFGIDPGSIRTGYGCVDSDGSRHRLVACGAVAPPARATFPEKLQAVHDGLRQLLRSTAPDCVLLWFLREGCWLDPRTLSLAPDQTESLDLRLRETIHNLEEPPTKLRSEHLAILARWFYSSWRDGEWIAVESWESVPYRRLVNAVHRAAKS